jgi:DNA-binding MarR family transcriptional regulator
MPMNCDNDDRFDKMRDHLLQHLLEMNSNIDVQSIELSSLIKSISNLYTSAIVHSADFKDLSGPRMGILLRLMVANKRGDTNGINPTQLSYFQHVKKNTISSLLRGLEEDGLVERTIDPNDKRAFLIRITLKGKEMIEKVGPERLKLLSDLASGLTVDEKTQLTALLEKLRRSMRERTDYSMRPLPDIFKDDFPD